MLQFSLFDDPNETLKPRLTRNDVRAGDAAEALVLFKLLNAGFDAHDTRRDLPYDIVVDLQGLILRVQVKGRSRPVRGRWEYRFVRGNPRTGSGSYAYAETDYDISAVVACSLEKVLFFAGVQPVIRVSTADFLRPGAEAESWEQAVQTFRRKPLLNQ
jgi:hypothetical protein